MVKHSQITVERVTMIRVGIVGCGLIGNKRAQVIKKDPESFLCAVADLNVLPAAGLLKECGEGKGVAYKDWEEMLEKEPLDAVVVATPNKFLKKITLRAAQQGMHVLCEKPLGKNIWEAERMVAVAGENGVILKTGFNHRYHPGIFKAHEMVEKGELGPLYFIRCVYGHGGRPGYDKEWRASKEICGGGELLDQGVHVVDLFRWFMGDFDEAYGHTPTYFWNMEVEDNAFAVFRGEKGQTASMHTSWTQWKNRFTFEVFGEAGYMIINGLGGSYGTETLTVGKRPMDESRTVYVGGVPEEETTIFDGPDLSWDLEWGEFTTAIREGREPLGSGKDGLEANRMIAAVYESAKTNRPVEIGTVEVENR